MKLPSMKYSSGNMKQNLSVFGGLNRRIGAGDGELINCEGLGATSYPALSPRAGRGVYNTYASPTDIYEWDGHVVVADGYNLLLDGKVVGNVSEGKKQFAVVNTRLVVWPDKVYYDFEDNSFHHMDAGVVADSADPSAYTANSITLGESNVYDHGKEVFTTVQYVYNTQLNIGDVYAKTYTALHWDGSAWVGEEEAETRIQDGWAGKFIKLRANSVAGVYNLNTRETETVRVMSPTVSTTVYEIRAYSEDMPELCAEIVSVSNKTVNNLPEAIYAWTVTFRIISAGDDSDKALSEIFEVGDWVTLKNIPGTNPSKEYKISAIEDETRTLTFTEDAFLVYGSFYYRLEEEQPEEWILRLRSSTYPGGEFNGIVYPPSITVYGFRLPKLPKGSVLFSDKAIPGNDTFTVTVKAWNCETGAVSTVQSETIESVVIMGGGYHLKEKYTDYTFIEGSGLISWAAEVNKGAPGMDFICSHNNRLYGVSNSANALNEDGTRNENFKTRIIYVSELGIPSRFSTFEGADTDSFQVAEASNGDFTAAVSYGDHVLFFKEHKVIKFYGDYPSQMGFTYDEIEGVKAGCEKSLVIANEVLYYMGRAGLCAYTGTVPQILGYKLDMDYDNVVCATDGKKLMVCGKGGEGYELLSYNIAENIWLREDASEIKAMALIGGKIHMVSGLQVLIDGGGTESVKWSAEFHPFTEGTFRKKRWKYIRVRAEFNAGATLCVSVKVGDEEYNTWLTAKNTGWHTLTIPMPLMRTDRVSLRLEGEGSIIVREVEREYQIGSDSQ